MTSNKNIGHLRFHQIEIIRPPSFSSPYLRDWHELQHQFCRPSSRHSSGSWYRKISPQHSGSSDNIKHWNFESLEYVIHLENTREPWSTSGTCIGGQWRPKSDFLLQSWDGRRCLGFPQDGRSSFSSYRLPSWGGEVRIGAFDATAVSRLRF